MDKKEKIQLQRKEVAFHPCSPNCCRLGVCIDEWTLKFEHTKGTKSNGGDLTRCKVNVVHVSSHFEDGREAF